MGRMAAGGCRGSPSCSGGTGWAVARPVCCDAVRLFTRQRRGRRWLGQCPCRVCAPHQHTAVYTAVSFCMSCCADLESREAQGGDTSSEHARGMGAGRP